MRCATGVEMKANCPFGDVELGSTSWEKCEIAQQSAHKATCTELLRPNEGCTIENVNVWLHDSILRYAATAKSSRDPSDYINKAPSFWCLRIGAADHDTEEQGNPSGKGPHYVVKAELMERRDGIFG